MCTGEHSSLPNCNNKYLALLAVLASGGTRGLCSFIACMNPRCAAVDGGGGEGTVGQWGASAIPYPAFIVRLCSLNPHAPANSLGLYTGHIHCSRKIATQRTQTWQQRAGAVSPPRQASTAAGQVLRLAAADWPSSSATTHCCPKAASRPPQRHSCMGTPLLLGHLDQNNTGCMLIYL